MSLSPKEIKRKLRFGDVTEIALKTGRKKGHVSQVLSKKRRDRKVEVAAARKFRMKVEDVFGKVA